MDFHPNLDRTLAYGDSRTRVCVGPYSNRSPANDKSNGGRGLGALRPEWATVRTVIRPGFPSTPRHLVTCGPQVETAVLPVLSSHGLGNPRHPDSNLKTQRLARSTSTHRSHPRRLRTTTKGSTSSGMAGPILRPGNEASLTTHATRLADIKKAPSGCSGLLL